jgi:predicted MFS family arabinose efflux permease
VYNLAWGSANFAAFFTAGPLISLHWATLFIVPAIATAVAAILLKRFLLPPHMYSKDHVPEESDHETGLDTPELRARAKTLLVMAWIGNSLAYVAINVLIPLLTQLSNDAGFSSLAAAVMLTSIWGFSRFFGFIVTWKWTAWHYKARWLLAAQLTLALSFAMLLLFHHPVLFIAMQILFGLSAALVYSSALYYAMHTSDGHGGHAGIHEALIGAGIALGPTIGALAGAGKTGQAALTPVALTVTATLLAGTAIMALLSRKPSQVSA